MISSCLRRLWENCSFCRELNPIRRDEIQQHWQLHQTHSLYVINQSILGILLNYQIPKCWFRCNINSTNIFNKSLKKKCFFWNSARLLHLLRTKELWPVCNFSYCWNQTIKCGSNRMQWVIKYEHLENWFFKTRTNRYWNFKLCNLKLLCAITISICCSCSLLVRGPSFVKPLKMRHTFLNYNITNMSKHR